MAEEFDRLDKDKRGELDAQELLRSNLLVKHARPEDVAGAWGVRKDCRSHGGSHIRVHCRNRLAVFDAVDVVG
jgi:hypothetical protein